MATPEERVEANQAFADRMRAGVGNLRAPDEVHDDWVDWLQATAFDGVWARPGLELRERSIATIATLTALVLPNELTSHVRIGLRNGLTPAECNAYHAAASLVSNDVVALLDVGVELLRSIGIGRRRALDALLPLLRGTLTQIDRSGLAGPLTGPAVRGDVDTLRAHLRQLSRGSPEDREIHRLLSIRLARLALQHGETSAAATVRGLIGRKRRREV